jgi:hypothetical protein
MEFSTKKRFVGCGEIYGSFGDWIVLLGVEWRAVIEKDPVQVSSVAGLRSSAMAVGCVCSASEMSGGPTMNKVGGALGIERILWLDLSKALDEKGAVDQYRCWHAFFLIAKRPRVWHVLDG